MGKIDHFYKVEVRWTGNKGLGTEHYKAYSRNYEIVVDGKIQAIRGSSDPLFLGDSTRYNPEDLFLSSLSACHMLWYLHLCSSESIVVLEYADSATGTMEILSDGSGRFVEVTLHPEISIRDQEHVEKAMALHVDANKKCFIANSCNFSISHKPKIKVAE